MKDEILRNASGYVDLTAYEAIKNYERNENRMEFKRGEIFEYEMRDRFETKLALVVSADYRANDRYINVIVMTDEPKGEINVPIVCQGIKYVDCGMVSFATNDRLGNYVKAVTAEEMAQVEAGIIKCLGIEMQRELPVAECTTPVIIPHEIDFSEELATARAEANIYKELYDKLLAKMLG